jgi:phosphate-selective porin OprO and OprP
MKLNQLIPVALAGWLFVLAAGAADNQATNSNGAAAVEIPAYTTAGNIATGTADEAEIKALKQTVQELSRRIQALEQEHAGQSPTNADVTRDQIHDLDQQVRILGRQRELDQESAAALAKTQPRITAGANGFSFGSADSNFVVSIHGLIQFDSRTFENNDKVPGSDSFLLRRARPILSGTVYRDFDFLLVPDFGNGTPGSSSSASTPSIYDAAITYRYSPAFQVQAGKFKAPVGLEYLQSDTYTFFNERSLVTDLVPGRDLGLALRGDIGGGVVNYTVGIFNGVGDARNSSNTSFEDNPEFGGRLFLQPFKQTGLKLLQNLGFGVGGSWGKASTTNTLGLPASTGGASSSYGYFTDGQQQFFAYTNGVLARGTHWRLSPQASYYYGPFGLIAEYAISDQEVQRTVGNTTGRADLHHTAWQVSGGWVLTGEDATFTGVTPKHPFDPRNGQWGAWQVVGRYAELDIDNAAFPFYANPASASEARSWSVGLNWYLNRNIRVNASYSRTDFTGGAGGSPGSAPGSVSSHPEEVFFTRVQLAF